LHHGRKVDDSRHEGILPARFAERLEPERCDPLYASLPSLHKFIL
jgi:hypothetical protein